MPARPPPPPLGGRLRARRQRDIHIRRSFADERTAGCIVARHLSLSPLPRSLPCPARCALSHLPAGSLLPPPRRLRSSPATRATKQIERRLFAGVGDETMRRAVGFCRALNNDCVVASSGVGGGSSSSFGVIITRIGSSTTAKSAAKWIHLSPSKPILAVISHSAGIKAFVMRTAVVVGKWRFCCIDPDWPSTSFT